MVYIIDKETGFASGGQSLVDASRRVVSAKLTPDRKVCISRRFYRDWVTSHSYGDSYTDQQALNDAIVEYFHRRADRFDIATTRA